MDLADKWLQPTWFIDSDSPEVEDFSAQVVGSSNDPTEIAVALFLAVRDGFRYDPYGLSTDPNSYRASAVAGSESNWCTPKAVLLTAAARHCGIPARLGFADVKNHLTTQKLSARMGTDLFAWHGYSELLLNDRWFKVSSAFNIELCERFGVKVLDFDGSDDALMHAYDTSGNKHMEYVRQRGSFDDLPLDEILADFREIYTDMVAPSTDALDDTAFADPAVADTAVAETAFDD